MNIFKVLANGGRSMSKSNASAFLGYLLHPYEDHGLGFEFLERFLKRFFENQDDIKFNIKGCDYEILFEQAFRDENKDIKKREIVDVVILCFEKNKDKLIELVSESKIPKLRTLKHVILLLNKVKIKPKVNQQLQAQFDNTIARLKIDKEKVISFYVSPDELNYHDIFSNFVENEKKTHFVWKSKGEEKANDIYQMLKEIIVDESEGKIEAINEYAKHTLLSFIRFIENDFKSQKVEEKEDAKEVAKIDFSEFYDEFRFKIEGDLSDSSKELVKQFSEFIYTTYPELYLQLHKGHPVCVFTNVGSVNIFSCTQRGKNLIFRFLLRNNKKSKAYNKFIELLTSKGYSPTETDWCVSLRENLEIDTLKSLFKEYYDIIKASR